MQPIRITPSCGCKTRGLGIAPVRPDIADFPVAVLVGGGFLLFAMVAAFALTSHEPSRPF